MQNELEFIQTDLTNLLTGMIGADRFVVTGDDESFVIATDNDLSIDIWVGFNNDGTWKIDVSHRGATFAEVNTESTTAAQAIVKSAINIAN